MKQLWIRYPNNQRDWIYQDRFRYLPRGKVPLSIWRTTVRPQSALRRDRLCVGKGKLDLGYLNQFPGQRQRRVFEMNNALFVSVTSVFLSADFSSTSVQPVHRLAASEQVPQSVARNLLDI